MEALRFKNIFGYRPLSWLNTGASDAAGQTAQDVINNRDRANFAQHSQGNLLINAALPSFQLNKNGEQLVDNNGNYNFTFNGYGSPVNNKDFASGLNKQGLQLYSSTSNTKDPVSELLGGNNGFYHVNLQPNIKQSTTFPTNARITNIVNVPLFFNDKYDKNIEVKGEYKAQEVSPHSSYTCIGKCGVDGTLQPSLTDIKESINSAVDANETIKERKVDVKKENKRYNDLQSKIKGGK